MFERELSKTISRLSFLIAAFLMGIVVLVEAIYIFNYRSKLYSEFLYEIQGETISLLNQMELENDLSTLSSSHNFAIYMPDSILIRRGPVPLIKEEGIHTFGDSIYITIKFFKFDKYQPYIFITSGDSFEKFLRGRVSRLYKIFIMLDALLLFLIYFFAGDLARFMTRTLVNKHRYLSQLVRKFHHDLRIPLSVIMLNVDDESVDREIRSSVKDAVRYIDEITLSFKSLYDEKRTLETINVREEVEHILDVFKTNLKAKDIEVETHLSDLKVMANRYMFRRLLLNLLDNAIRYSPRGGRIRVEVGRGRMVISNKGNYVGQEGTGLKTVKFITDYHGWMFQIRQKDCMVEAIVIFRDR